MKSMKKTVAIMVILVLCLTILIPVSAFADTDTGNIILYVHIYDNNNETYTAFKIFDVTKADPALGDTTNQTIANQSAETAEEGVAYFLPAGSPWLSIAKNSDVAAYLTFSGSDESGYSVSWNLYDATDNPNGKAYSEANAIALADLLNALLHEVVADGTVTGYYVGSDPENTLTLDEDYFIIRPSLNWSTYARDNIVPIGYYLLTSSLGANLILATTDIEILEKNHFPMVDKIIISTSDDTPETMNAQLNDYSVFYDSYGHATGAQIGDTIRFQTAAFIPDEANHSFELHDVMDPGLSLKLSENTFTVKKTVNDVTVEVPSGEGANTNWFVQYSTDSSKLAVTGTNSQEGVSGSAASADGTFLSDEDSFVVVFTENYLKGLNLREDGYDALFTVEYDAVLNSNATVVSEGEPNNNGSLPFDGSIWNRNEVTLVYSNYSTWADAYVLTYLFEIAKFTGEDDGTSGASSSKAMIPGATFQLYRDTQIGSNGKLISGAVPITFYAYEAAPGWFKVADGLTAPQGAQAVTALTSPVGAFHLEGLDAGDYYLLETEAPAGFNRLPYMVKVTVTEQPDVFTPPRKVGSRIYVSDSATESGGNITYHMPSDPAIPYIIAGPIDPNDPGSPLVYYYGGVGIQNNAGAVLPRTGGMGTTCFYLFGAMLLLGAGIIPLTRRKAKEKN